MPFRPLRGYFYLYLHSTLILQTITLYCVPPPSWDFVSLQFDFGFVPFIPGLISRTSTSLRFVLTSLCFVLPRYTLFYLATLVLPRSRHFVVLACILSISLRSRSIFHYIHRTTIDGHTPSFTFIIRSFSVGYWLIYLLISLFWPYRNCSPELRTY